MAYAGQFRQVNAKIQMSLRDRQGLPPLVAILISGTCLLTPGTIVISTHR